MSPTTRYARRKPALGSGKDALVSAPCSSPTVDRRSVLYGLPNELLVQIMCSCPDLTTSRRLALSGALLYKLWEQHRLEDYWERRKLIDGFKAYIWPRSRGAREEKASRPALVFRRYTLPWQAKKLIQEADAMMKALRDPNRRFTKRELIVARRELEVLSFFMVKCNLERVAFCDTPRSDRLYYLFPLDHRRQGARRNTGWDRLAVNTGLDAYIEAKKEQLVAHMECRLLSALEIWQNEHVIEVTEITESPE